MLKMKAVSNYIRFDETSERDLNSQSEDEQCLRKNEFILEISHFLSETCGNGREIEFWMHLNSHSFRSIIWDYFEILEMKL